MKTHFIPLFALLLINLLPTSNCYGELYRPGYHFTPPINWMNDPNGLVYFNGLHHLYYQYNPYGTSWGNMSWGHAISSDLVHWMNLPVAMPMYNDIMIYSGSVIVDVDNTSGFCESKQQGCLVAFYTQQSSTGEAQGVAYSNNNGFSYTQYQKNPIININSTDFRDPWVFWYEPQEKWVMVVALATLYKIRIYSSVDLLNWTQESDFGPDGSSTVGVWEDPDLFPMTVEGETTQKWVLTHSVGSWETVYYIGDFDGTTFTDTDTVNQTNLISIGLDFSEAVSYNNEPTGRRLMMGWMDNRLYGDWAPTSTWRGQQSMIRELKLRRYPEGLKMAQSPLEELAMLRYSPEHYDNLQLTQSNSTFNLQNKGTQYEIIAEFAYPSGTGDIPTEFGLNVFVGEGQITIIGYDVQNQTLFVNRTYSGDTTFSPQWTNITSFPMPPVNGTVQIRAFLDQSSIEVFGNDGKVAITNLVFPDPTKDQVQVYVIGGSVNVTSVDAWLLHGIWPNSTGATEVPQMGERGFLVDWSIIQ